MTTLLHKDGAYKRGVAPNKLRVQQLLSFAQLNKKKKEAISEEEQAAIQAVGKKTKGLVMEVGLVLFTNGLILGFTRERPSDFRHGKAEPEELQSMLMLKPLAKTGSAIAPTRPAGSMSSEEELELLPSIKKLPNRDALVILSRGMLDAYSIGHELLTNPEGIKNDSTTLAFEQRMPEEVRGKTQAVAVHPHDSNLYVVACRDGSVVVKNLALEDRFQTLGKTAVASEGSATPTPAPHLFFTSSGNMFVLCKTIDKSEFGQEPIVTLETYPVPENALVPSSRNRQRPRNEQPAQGAQKGAKKRLKEEEADTVTAWVKEQTVQNRGTRLLPPVPLNTLHLDGRDHPRVVLPVPLSPDDRRKADLGKEVREAALFLWPDALQLYAVAGDALRLKQTSEDLRGMRCILHLVWPPTAPGNASASGDAPAAEHDASKRYWLLGTASDELHLLNEELKPTSIAAHGKALPGAPAGVRLLPAAQAAAETPLGIAALTLIGGPEKQEDVAPLAEHAGLCVGFDDGSVRQYRLVDVLHAF